MWDVEGADPGKAKPMHARKRAPNTTSSPFSAEEGSKNHDRPVIGCVAVFPALFIRSLCMCVYERETRVDIRLRSRYGLVLDQTKKNKTSQKEDRKFQNLKPPDSSPMRELLSGP